MIEESDDRDCSDESHIVVRLFYISYRAVQIVGTAYIGVLYCVQ
jgi:hypothetical protein